MVGTLETKDSPARGGEGGGASNDTRNPEGEADDTINDGTTCQQAESPKLDVAMHD
jgi:hypothetical protein